MAGRPPNTPETEFRRLRGFQLYLDSGSGGKRRSLRSIAMEVGVHPSTAIGWKDKDHWDERLNDILTARSQDHYLKASEVTGLLHSSLATHIGALNQVIRTASKDADRIKAIVAFVDIYRKLGLKLGIDDAPGVPLNFSDELTDVSLSSGPPVRVGLGQPVDPTTEPDRGDSSPDDTSAEPADSGVQLGGSDDGGSVATGCSAEPSAGGPDLDGESERGTSL